MKEVLIGIGMFYGVGLSLNLMLVIGFWLTHRPQSQPDNKGEGG